MEQGAGALNNAELLAVILRTGSVGENSLELASRLLAIESLSGLVSMTVAQLTKIRGIGKVKAIQLQCIGELSRRLSASRQQGIVLDSPQAVGNYYICLLYTSRLGDFYEMFFDDAITASKALEITLTGKECGLEERAPMCGVPFHAADNYIDRLVKKGYRVAIAEQMEDPKLAKGLVKREVIRVVTPGTICDNKALDETCLLYTS